MLRNILLANIEEHSRSAQINYLQKNNIAYHRSYLSVCDHLLIAKITFETACGGEKSCDHKKFEHDGPDAEWKLLFYRRNVLSRNTSSRWICDESETVKREMEIYSFLSEASCEWHHLYSVLALYIGVGELFKFIAKISMQEIDGNTVLKYPKLYRHRLIILEETSARGLRKSRDNCTDLLCKSCTKQRPKF